MSTNPEPIIDSPALLLLEGTERAMVIADLHLGIEHAIADAGVRIAKRTWLIQEKILELIKRTNIDRLIILGDIKHTVPSTSWQETQELPEFFRGLLRQVENIDIVIGNHDTALTNLLPQEIQLHDAAGWKYANIGLTHGHKWPTAQVIDSEVLVHAHNHPTVSLIDELGVQHSYQCWVRGPIIDDNLIEKYGEEIEKGPSEIILIPSFVEIGSGTTVNVPNQNLLGPILKNKILNLPESKIYLLDGSFLGTIKNLLLKK